MPAIFVYFILCDRKPENLHLDAHFSLFEQIKGVFLHTERQYLQELLFWFEKNNID